jgi:predicted adenylyl cyclase CyaB
MSYIILQCLTSKGKLFWEYYQPVIKVATDDPDGLRRLLSEALGIEGTVRKKRHLFLVGQTRIHLDEVEGLGNFLELEVVLQNGQKPEEGMAIAAGLMEKLGVKKEDLIAGAYIDLIKQRNSGLGVREW